MDNMVINQRMRWGRNIITAENALIEEINWDSRTAFVTISYEVMDRNRIRTTQFVTLIVGRDTVIRDSSGRLMSFRNLREGMRVNAVFSATMTRSIPPQSRAFSITVVGENNQSAFSEGTIMEVDPQWGFFVTGDPLNMYTQVRYNVSDSTTIRDRRGREISLWDLRPGDFVRIEHATFQTMSIPPQTPAYEVQIIN